QAATSAPTISARTPRVSNAGNRGPRNQTTRASNAVPAKVTNQRETMKARNVVTASNPDDAERSQCVGFVLDPRPWHCLQWGRLRPDPPPTRAIRRRSHCLEFFLLPRRGRPTAESSTGTVYYVWRGRRCTRSPRFFPVRPLARGLFDRAKEQIAPR